MTLVAFVLSLFLREVPLRSSNRDSSELAGEEAVAKMWPTLQRQFAERGARV